MTKPYMENEQKIYRSLTTRCILDRHDATIRITPLVDLVDKLSKEVEDSPRKVILDLQHLLEKDVSLADAYAELKRRKSLKKYRVDFSILNDQLS
ncbi:PREDICTED: RPW8-like protein 3 [Camelina sativa]|uniref:RPW8-like protein 3 n=1 Tax=Camelina sativa TaxID=90675 RepID=A0ABM1QTR6_CAMSA|nr:PREDICTED: RPW8-like protein 3 [Camelina sativa]